MTASDHALATPTEVVARPRMTYARVVHRHGWRAVTKTTIDRVLAAVLLATAVLPMILIAVAIRLTSAGPAIFRQTRLGRDGRPFEIWKFRTMVDGAHAMVPAGNDADGLLFKLRDDPRVTTVGRFLRRWSLDELPQLVNVLLGDMSLVGPRPLPVSVAAHPARALRRLEVKPGITGLWQVNGRSDLEWEACVRLDLAYVDGWSLALDLAILFRTLGAVIRRAGAY